MAYFVQSNLCERLVNDVVHKIDDIQKASTVALAESLSEHPQLVENILQQLVEVYTTKLQVQSTEIHHNNHSQ